MLQALVPRKQFYFKCTNPFKKRMVKVHVAFLGSNNPLGAGQRPNQSRGQLHGVQIVDGFGTGRVRSAIFISIGTKGTGKDLEW